MEKVILFFCLLAITGNTTAQESFKKKYYAFKSINYKKDGPLYLKKDTIVKYNDLTKKEKDSISNLLINKKVTIVNEILSNGKKVTVAEDKIIDEEYLQKMEFTKSKNIQVEGKIYCDVKFEESKLYINPYLQSNINRNDVYYYKLKNRQTVKLSFFEGNISALTLPIKYRFKSKNGINEDFTSSVNVNIFGGPSWGKTSFFHREKVDNKTNTWKFTLGALIGASTVELNSENTSAANIPIEEGKKATKGLTTIGLGLTYTFNKINFGTFVGSDYAIGRNSEKWNYNKKPWIGIAVGYSILSI